MPNVTGQLFTRDMGEDNHSGRPNKRIVMVFGILSVNENLLDTETQYTIVGNTFDGILNLALPLDQKINHGRRFLGNTPSGILCEGIWRV
jgi:hypothetical protein